jgi:predicted DNA-binding protein YlxM (UPF0122 family)
MEKHYISLLNDHYGALLTDKQEEMLRLFYNEDFSLAEIAEEFSVSRQAVRDAVKRGEEALLEYEQKLGNAKLFKTLTEECDALIECLKDGDADGAALRAQNIKTALEG